MWTAEAVLNLLLFKYTWWHGATRETAVPWRPRPRASPVCEVRAFCADRVEGAALSPQPALQTLRLLGQGFYPAL